MNTLLIFFGAGTGGVFRYWVSTITYWLAGRDFPYGTLIVNITGSFIMGLLFVVLLERMSDTGGSLRSLLLIGFLGGYTTFSSFSIETITLIENGSHFNAALNILLSVTLCLLAAWFGVMGGRQL